MKLYSPPDSFEWLFSRIHLWRSGEKNYSNTIQPLLSCTNITRVHIYSCLVVHSRRNTLYIFLAGIGCMAQIGTSLWILQSLTLGEIRQCGSSKQKEIVILNFPSMCQLFHKNKNSINFRSNWQIQKFLSPLKTPRPKLQSYNSSLANIKLVLFIFIS